MKKIAPVLLFAIATPLVAQPPSQQQPNPTDRFFEQLDTDKDGKVSQEEYLKPGVEQFGKIDKNGDGYVSRDEAEAYHSQMQQRMEQMRRQMLEKRQQQGREAPSDPSGGPTRPGE
jgi:Ca2+-binding EF-hand superfamily protein